MPHSENNLYLMTTEQVIQQFIQAIGNSTWTEQQVCNYFTGIGIEPQEILGALYSTPGIHNRNGNVWYSTAVVKLPPNQPH